MNPSTDDLLKAVLSTPAEHVFILPNNKNIIMAAEQVDPLTDRDVRVLHTKTIPQGIAALLNVDDSLSAEENHLTMMKAAEKVLSPSPRATARLTGRLSERVRYSAWKTAR